MERIEAHTHHQHEDPVGAHACSLCLHVCDYVLDQAQLLAEVERHNEAPIERNADVGRVRELLPDRGRERLRGPGGVWACVCE